MVSFFGGDYGRFGIPRLLGSGGLEDQRNAALDAARMQRQAERMRNVANDPVHLARMALMCTPRARSCEGCGAQTRRQECEYCGRVG